jgi:23S rRNA pseudouridine1911/1915/1917 synthase
MIECHLETGRTHQIRVHLASIGHPLIGDDVYGPGFRTKTALLGPEAKLAVDTLGRQALHAYLLGVEHPGNKDFLEFHSPLPPELGTLRQSLTEPVGESGGKTAKRTIKSKLKPLAT